MADLRLLRIGLLNFELEVRLLLAGTFVDDGYGARVVDPLILLTFDCPLFLSTGDKWAALD